MRLADGLLLVVDVLEGVGAATERAIQQAVAEGLAITLLISKVRGCLSSESECAVAPEQSCWDSQVVCVTEGVPLEGGLGGAFEGG